MDEIGSTVADTAPLLKVVELKKHFPIKKGMFSRTVGHLRTVDGVSFYINPGKTLGLVGESGCGKTTTGRVEMRAYDVTDGEIWFQFAGGKRTDVAALSSAEVKMLRRHMQMVFQDPYSSLNPRMNLLQNVGEPLLVNNVAQGQELEDRVSKLLRVVGLRPEYLNRYPHAFSGGQRQRPGAGPESPADRFGRAGVCHGYVRTGPDSEPPAGPTGGIWPDVPFCCSRLERSGAHQ